MADNVDESFKTVWTVNTVEEATVVVGFLQSSGIEASVESLHSSEFPTEVGSLAEVRINVPAEQAADALLLLRDMESGVAEGSDAPPPRPVLEG